MQSIIHMDLHCISEEDGKYISRWYKQSIVISGMKKAQANGLDCLQLQSAAFHSYALQQKKRMEFENTSVSLPEPECRIIPVQGTF
jgi:hypothetical protein